MNVIMGLVIIAGLVIVGLVTEGIWANKVKIAYYKSGAWREEEKDGTKQN